MKDNYTFHLFVLFVGVAVATFFFIYFEFNQVAQLLSALFGCTYYVIWGIIHHAVIERTNRLIILEYILVGSIFFLLIATILTL